MALVLYSNGIIEELVSSEDTFTDNELISVFENYKSLKSIRLGDIKNTWCLWGEIDNPPDIEFNKLATTIVEKDVNSHLVFLHDSEINESWNLTDDSIQSYVEFKEEIGHFINMMFDEISETVEDDLQQSESTSMIFLTAMGHTQDKRVLFAFNPNEQRENFYLDNSFEIFASKIYEYLTNNFYKEPTEKNKPFVIFADAKTIVIVENKWLNDFVDRLIKIFTIREQYENCTFITKIKKDWDNNLNCIDSSMGIKKRRGRPPKNKGKDKNA